MWRIRNGNNVKCAAHCHCQCFFKELVGGPRPRPCSAHSSAALLAFLSRGRLHDRRFKLAVCRLKGPGTSPQIREILALSWLAHRRLVFFVKGTWQQGSQWHESSGRSLMYPTACILIHTHTHTQVFIFTSPLLRVVTELCFQSSSLNTFTWPLIACYYNGIKEQLWPTEHDFFTDLC